jgi:putative transcriptional regulator
VPALLSRHVGYLGVGGRAVRHPWQIAKVTWQLPPGGRTITAVTKASGPRLANRLRIARAERNLSQTELAQAVGVSRQTISSIETGQYGPSALLALRLADTLGTPIADLFWIEGDRR